MKSIEKSLGAVVFAISLLAMVGLAIWNADSAVAWDDLSLAEMGTIVGGVKHCDDSSCSGFTCDWSEMLEEYTQTISNGTTGRECIGSPAASCCAENPAVCATTYYNCNSDCTTCSRSVDTTTNQSCASSN